MFTVQGLSEQLRACEAARAEVETTNRQQQSSLQQLTEEVQSLKEELRKEQDAVSNDKTSSIGGDVLMQQELEKRKALEVLM